MRESEFQASLIRELKSRIPGCIVLKNDANYIQGFPDLLLLVEDKWFALEVKATRRSAVQPNQEYYIDILDQMSVATFVYPDNKEEVIHEIQQSLRARR